MEQKKVKKAIHSDEINNFNVMPYTGHDNHAPAHPDITAFVELMLSKGYTKDEILILWGTCQGIKLEAQEHKNKEKFDGAEFQSKFQGELTPVRAVCCLLRHLSTADMDLYFYTWLDAVRNAKLPQTKEPIIITELHRFDVQPYTGHENYAPEHQDIVAFVQLMLNKGYQKEDLIIAWGECMGIKLEAHERGNEEKFDSAKFHPKFQGEMTLLRAVCYLFRRLLTVEMDLYYCAWLDAVRNAKLPERAPATE